MKNFKRIPSVSPKFSNFNQQHTSKKNCFFWLNLYKIEVIITSLIEMLALPNFDYLTTCPIQFESHDKSLLVKSSAEVMAL